MTERLNAKQRFDAVFRRDEPHIEQIGRALEHFAIAGLIKQDLTQKDAVYLLAQGFRRAAELLERHV